MLPGGILLRPWLGSKAVCLVLPALPTGTHGAAGGRRAPCASSAMPGGGGCMRDPLGWDGGICVCLGAAPHPCPLAASPLGADLTGRGAATPSWTPPTPLQPPWSPLPECDADRSAFPTGSFIFCTCCAEPWGGRGLLWEEDGAGGGEQGAQWGQAGRGAYGFSPSVLLQAGSCDGAEAGVPSTPAVGWDHAWARPQGWGP